MACHALLLTAVVSLASGLACASGGDPRKHVTLADMVGLQPADVTVDLSSDGGRVAYSVDGQSIWIASTHGHTPPTLIGDGFLPLWAPAGDQLAFYRVGKSDGIQLWVFRPGDGSAVQLTHIDGGIDPDPSTRIAGPVRDAFRYSWSPDGRSIAFASRVAVGASEPESSAPGGEKPLAGPLVLTESTPPSWTLSGIFADAPISVGVAESKDGRTVSAKQNHHPRAILASRLFIVNVTSGETRRLHAGAFNDFSPHWAPDGAHILCASSEQGSEVFAATAINIHRIEVSSGRRKALTAGAAVRSRPTWSASGEEFAFLERPTFFGQTALVVASSNGDDFRNLTARLDRDVRQFAWLSRTSLLVTYRDGVSVPLAIIEDTRLPTISVVSPRDHQTPASVGEVVAASQAAAWTQSTAARPGALYFAGSIGAAPSVLIDFYPQVREWQLGSAEVIRWRTSAGEEKEGTLLKPPGHQQGSTAPLIVDAYPAGTGNDWLDPMSGNQAWAALGYMVFRPSPRAPNAWLNHWKGAHSHELAKGPDGWDIAVDDVLSGVDELIRRGLVDDNRMCVFGFSNGATVVNVLITRSHRFKCAISVAPAMSDWVRPALLNTDQLHVLAIWAGGPNIWEDPQRYVRLSPVFQLNKVRTPVLLAAGDRDGDFLLNSIETYNGLRNAGREVTLLRYPDQGHGFNGAALEDFWTRQLAFFAKYLSTDRKKSDTLTSELPATLH